MRFGRGRELSPHTVRRRFDALKRDLLDLETATGEAAAELLTVARRDAGGHPTPQARMAASGLQVVAGAVIGYPSTVVHGAGGSAVLGGGFGFGAVSGGDTRHGLAPSRRGGYWLLPDAAAMGSYLDPVADAVGDAVERLDR